MIRSLTRAAVALALTLLWGCGNKGPLYLPVPEQPAAAPAGEQVEQQPADAAAR